MGNLASNMQGQGSWDGISGMDPAVEVEHVVGDIIGMDTVDGVAHILARGNDHREGEKDHRADAPMQAEH